VGALEAQGRKFSGANGGTNVTKGFMVILKRERTTNLYKMKESIIVGDASAATKEDTIRF